MQFFIIMLHFILVYASPYFWLLTQYMYIYYFFIISVLLQASLLQNAHLNYSDDVRRYRPIPLTCIYEE